MLRKKPSLLFAPLALSLGAVLFSYTSSHAQLSDIRMHNYTSPTGVFQLQMPGTPTSDITWLRASDRSVYSSEKTILNIDQRPYVNEVKNFFVQTDQTLGSALSENEKQSLLEREMAAYIGHYTEQRKATLHKQEKKQLTGGVFGGELYMTFDDETGTPQALRARILISDITKLQQLSIGPDKLAYSLPVQNFFESMKLLRGASAINGSFDEDWNVHVSPLQIFTVLLPPVSAPYVMAEPVVTTPSGNLEIIQHVIEDPVRRQKIFYSVHGYKTGQPLDFDLATKIVLSQHISRYLRVPRGVKFLRQSNNMGQPVLETSFMLPRKSDTDVQNVLRLRAMFLGDYMVVQEVATSETLTQSQLVQNMMELIHFHPEQAYELAQKRDADGSANDASEQASPVAVTEESSPPADIPATEDATESAE